MADKKCLVFETLGKVSDLQISESASNEVRLSGVFGVCGIKNQNNRVYDKENYRQMVESLQKTIATEGCPGELEHPNSMNINLENVSHKIESIQMNEDGTITGTILLLNTPKGQIAKAIVEGGLPLYISSRGAGTITNEGRVTLSTIKTYDLVGTPGFSQAKLTLNENQTVECLNESLDEGNISWAIVYEDKKDEDSADSVKDDVKDDSKEDKKEDKKEDSKDDSKEDKKEDSKEEDNKEKDNKNKINSEIDMEDLKNAIDKLTDKVTSLEAELHVAQESLNEIRPINYEAIENWIKEEFAPIFKDQLYNEISESMANSLEDWVTEEFAPYVQGWITEEFAPEVQGWVTEEFAPEVQGWVTEEFAPKVQNWITEEFAPEVQGWVTEEFAPEVQGWVTEEYSPVVEKWVNEEFGSNLENKIVESQKSGRLDEIDSILESLSNNTDSVESVVKEANDNGRFNGVYVVENMPAEFKPSWEMLDESRQDEIVRSSRMYDFTKEGVLESFWSNVDFSKKDNTVSVNENNNDVISNYHNNVFNQMMRLRKNV